jgi:predicted nucleic acid-binding protein
MAGRTGKPVDQQMAFWDASALVPLCVRQGFTPRVISFYKSYQPVIWWATPVEIASALARLVRMKQIHAGDLAKSRRMASTLADTWAVVQPSDALRAKAVQLVGRYDLRAGDAFQLAAALEWCDDSPHGCIFLAADEKLREAAVLSGFDSPEI